MVVCRTFEQADYEFLREMLFEAVFWSRTPETLPTLEEGLSYEYTRHILSKFGKVRGDLAVVAEIEGEKAGAAFIRFWNVDTNMRGYLSDEVPVLVIGVARAFRNQGVGTALMNAIKQLALENDITKISLCVTKTNVAYQLYDKQDFKIIEEIDESYNMLWTSQQ